MSPLYFDLFALALLLLSLLLGWWRGLIYEFLSLLGWVAAYWLAQYFAAYLSPVLPALIPALAEWGEAAHYALAFVLLIVLALIAANLLAWLLKTLTKMLGLGLLDRFFGALFGLLRAVLILLAITAVVHMTPLAQSAFWQGARVAPHLDAGLSITTPYLPAKIRSFLPVTEPQD